MSGELWFYHLERTTLADALPELLEKTLQKGWCALVRAPGEERLKHIDGLLWTARDDSFLAHGRWDDANPERQPILLSLSEDNANQADILFALDGVEPEQPGAFKRCAIVFDAADENAVQSARALWKKAKADGHSIAYWKQSIEGRWEKQG